MKIVYILASLSNMVCEVSTLGLLIPSHLVLWCLESSR